MTEPITPSNTPTLKWESRNKNEYKALVGYGTVTGYERYIVAYDKARRHWYVVVPGDIDRAHTTHTRKLALAWAQKHWQHEYALDGGVEFA